MKKLILVWVVLGGLCCSVLAVDDRAPVGRPAIAPPGAKLLDLGDTLPPLSGLEWIQGSDPMAGENKPEYMLYDCWATWCGPCIQTIPHLNALAAEYADKSVGVVGIAVWDSLGQVKAFLKNDKVEMAYPVAVDAFGFVVNKWLLPSGQGGVPYAFLVKMDTLQILWSGHPMMADGILKQVIAGTYDIRIQRQRQAFEAKLQAAIEVRDWAAAEVAVSEWKTVDPSEALAYELWIQIQKRDEGETCRALKQVIAKPDVASDEVMSMMGLMVLALDAFPESKNCHTLAAEGAAKYAVLAPDNGIVQGMYWYALNADGQYVKAAKVADKLIDKDGGNKDKLSEFAKSLLLKDMELRYVKQATRAVNRALELDGEWAPALLQKMRLEGFEGHKTNVQNLAEALLAIKPGNGELLNEGAWELLTDKRIKGDYKAIALLLAERAEILTDGKNPAVLDTFALAEFKNGNIERAIELEKAAIALVPKYEALQLQLQMFEDALREKNSAVSSQDSGGTGQDLEENE